MTDNPFLNCFFPMNLFLLPQTILKGEGTSLHEGGLYFISLQNGSTLGTHLLIDAK
jgi:hypothetical protein